MCRVASIQCSCSEICELLLHGRPSKLILELQSIISRVIELAMISMELTLLTSFGVCSFVCFFKEPYVCVIAIISTTYINTQRYLSTLNLIIITTRKCSHSSPSPYKSITRRKICKNYMFLFFNYFYLGKV